MNARFLAGTFWVLMTLILIIISGFWEANDAQVFLVILLYVGLSAISFAIIVEDSAAREAQDILDRLLDKE